MVKWVGLLIAWVIVAGLLWVAHLTILIWVIMVALIAYVVSSILRDTPHAGRPRRRRAAAADIAHDGRERFNPPPGWPEPPPDWTPPPGWRPNAAWPPAPPGWQFWVRTGRRDLGGSTAHTRSHGRQPDDDRFTDSWP